MSTLAAPSRRTINNWLGAQDAYEAIRKRMIEVRDQNGSLRVTVLRPGAIVELSGTVEQ